jgi:hypothetical protein
MLFQLLRFYGIKSDGNVMGLMKDELATIWIGWGTRAYLTSFLNCTGYIPSNVKIIWLVDPKGRERSWPILWCQCPRICVEGRNKTWQFLNYNAGLPNYNYYATTHCKIIWKEEVMACVSIASTNEWHLQKICRPKFESSLTLIALVVHEAARYWPWNVFNTSRVVLFKETFLY